MKYVLASIISTSIGMVVLLSIGISILEVVIQMSKTYEIGDLSPHLVNASILIAPASLGFLGSIFSVIGISKNERFKYFSLIYSLAVFGLPFLLLLF